MALSLYYVYKRVRVEILPVFLSHATSNCTVKDLSLEAMNVRNNVIMQ